MHIDKARELAAQLWCLPQNEHKVMDPVLCESIANLLVQQFKHVQDVVDWASATLTALNTGDVHKESLLHLKLRQVIVKYREHLE